MVNRHEERKKLCDKLRETEDRLVEIMLSLDVTEARGFNNFIEWLEDLERITRIRRELCSW